MTRILSILLSHTVYFNKSFVQLIFGSFAILNPKLARGFHVARYSLLCFYIFLHVIEILEEQTINENLTLILRKCSCHSVILFSWVKDVPASIGLFFDTFLKSERELRFSDKNTEFIIETLIETLVLTVFYQM